MRLFDDTGKFLCNYQANLFAYSTKKNVGSKSFIRTFAFSNLAERMDNPGFIYETTDVPQAFDEVKDRIPDARGQVYNEAIISWIGYIYRYISYIYDRSTKEVYRLIKPDELFAIYDAYHSLDNEMAAKRLLESKDIDFSKVNDLEMLRKIYLGK